MKTTHKQFGAAETVPEYLARIGRNGGKVKGPAKRRGGKKYYKALSAKGVAARKQTRKDEHEHT